MGRLSKTKTLALVCAVSPFIVAASCQPTTRLTKNEFTKYLRDEGGYNIQVVPSTLESAGALVYVREANGNRTIEWVDDLLSCGVPAEVMYGTGEEADRLRNAAFPNFTTKVDTDFTFNLGLGIKGVGANADFSRIRRSHVTVDEAGHETFKRLAVASYIVSPVSRATLKDYCVEALEEHKAAVLVDVAYIEKGKVDFYGTTGAGGEVKLPQAEVIRALDLDADARLKVDTSGTMTIDERVYVAFKDSFFVPGDIGSLAGGEGSLESADAYLASAE